MSAFSGERRSDGWATTGASTGSTARSRPPGADLCEIADLDDDALFDALVRAQALAGDGAAPYLPEVLRGRTVLVHFGEPSTRTRMSFEIAARRLGADFVAFAGDHSTSAAKGETLLDAVRNVDAMGPDVIVVRERHEGWPRALTECLRARVVNAGDGCNEHPTQGLLDALTILEAFGRSPRDGDRALRGIRVAICGDIAHSRVAGSDLRLLPRLGAEVRVAGPAGLVDPGGLPPGVALAPSLEAAIAGVDVVMMLRIQRERLPTALDLPSDAAYHALWGLSAERLALASPRAIVMHPGPMNRGVEIADAVADGPRSRILRQVALGVAARMVVLARACDRHTLLPTEAPRSVGGDLRRAPADGLLRQSGDEFRNRQGDDLRRPPGDDPGRPSVDDPRRATGDDPRRPPGEDPRRPPVMNPRELR